MTTLARLSFGVPADQLGPFATAYERQLAPILRHHGLVAITDPGRATADGIFTRLFAVETPAAVADHDQALKLDPAWQQTLQQLGPAFFGPEHKAPLTYRLDLYQTPAGPGKRVQAGSGQTVEAGPGRSVTVGPGFRLGLWHSFGLSDGMPDYIVDLLQDRHGNLWLASGLFTIGQLKRGLGLWRFDGLQMSHFTTADGLPNDAVNGLLEDRDGQLWVGTDAGVSRYDGQHFTTYTTADGLAGNRVLALLEDRDGQLWFGAGLKGAPVGVSRYDGQTFKNFTAADGLASDLVISLLEDRSGQLWFGTDQAVSRYDGQTFTTAFTTDERQYLGGVPSMLEDRAGNLFFAIWGEGVRRYDGNTYVTFTPQDGLTTNTVDSLLEDRDGQIWVGTFNGGMSCNSGQRLATFTTAEGLAHNYTYALWEDRRGRLWVGTHGGVSGNDGARFSVLEGTDKVVNSLLVDRRGHLWFSIWGQGVGRYDGQRTETFPIEGLSWGDARLLLEDGQGRLWIVTTGDQEGLSYYDGEGWTPFTRDIGLAPNAVSCMLEDRAGQLWFGGDGGVSRYDGQQVEVFTTDDGLVHDEVLALREDRSGRLWIGTQGGLSRYDGKDFTTFTAADGLPHDQVCSVLQDQAGQMWIGIRGGGVVRYDGRVFQYLSRQDGLASDQITHLLQDRQGAIWIATADGLHRYQPSPHPPQVQLKTVIANQHYAPDGPICIPSLQKLVAFEFEGRSWTTRPERMAYVYRLEGYDADWQSVYSNRVAYQDLPVGEYTFRVKAVDRDLNYSEVAQVNVAVEPDALAESLTAALGQSSPQGEFVGRSAALKKVQQQLRHVAPADLTVLILGETGTGKGLAARTLHELSPRRQARFIQVNCGAIPETLIESDLFGHEKGAFTGATSRHLGKVELASGGSLFLDEIGDMSRAAQVKLLRLLEERTFERVGGADVLTADVRVVAATNRDLEQMVREGAFREDLFYRLQGFEIHLPPLRARREDIPLLALYCIGPKAAHLDKEVTGLSQVAEEALVAHSWPGNVRELQHTIERAVVVCQGSTIEVDDLMLSGRAVPTAAEGNWMSLEEMERRHIRAVLEDRDWIIAGPQGAAIVLGLHEATLRFRMRKLGIKRPKA